MERIRVGDILRTQERMGQSQQTRLRCGACRRWMPTQENPICSCGAVYRAFSEGFHQVVSRG